MQRVAIVSSHLQPVQKPVSSGSDGFALAEEALAELITKLMIENDVPAVSACIIKRGQLVWSRAFGLANLERNIPASTETIFALASVTKTITAVGLMQLEEIGLVDLDVDVSEYLPFRVQHPLHKQAVITLRGLMTHTASINDSQLWMGDGRLGSGLGAAGGDPTVNLVTSLRGYLTPEGDYFSAEDNFHSWSPDAGFAYCYSNVGIALVGLIVQQVSGEDYYEYCTSHILRPLGMDASFWRYSDMLHTDFPMERLAMPYAPPMQQKMKKDQRPLLIPYGVYSYPDTPAGNLRTSAPQLAMFLAMFASGGCIPPTIGGLTGEQQQQRTIRHMPRLLKEETVAKMMAPQYPDAKIATLHMAEDGDAGDGSATLELLDPAGSGGGCWLGPGLPA